MFYYSLIVIFLFYVEPPGGSAADAEETLNNIVEIQKPCTVARIYYYVIMVFIHVLCFTRAWPSKKQY